MVSFKLQAGFQKLLFLPMQVDGLSFLSLQILPLLSPISLPSETPQVSLSSYPLPGVMTHLESQKFVTREDLTSKLPNPSFRERKSLVPHGCDSLKAS